MDYDKLIKRLNQEAYGSDIEDLLLDAAAAIETLWAKFRARDSLVDQLEARVYELTGGGIDADTMGLSETIQALEGRRNTALLPGADRLYRSAIQHLREAERWHSSTK